MKTIARPPRNLLESPTTTYSGDLAHVWAVQRKALWLAGALVLSACQPEAPTTPVQRAVPSLGAAGSAQVHRTSDDDLADLVDQIPGFGGFFYDSTGTLTIYLKQPAALAAARLQMAEFLGRRVKQSPDRLRQIREQIGAMQVGAAKYDFRELLALYRTLVLPNVYGFGRVTLTDIDDRHNRILIGVQEAAMIGPMRQRLATLAVPADAIDVVQFGEAVPFAAPSAAIPVHSTGFALSQNLTSDLRPAVPGGARIQILLTSSGGTLANNCTLGFNLFPWVNGAVGMNRYFLTNSHCFFQQEGSTGSSVDAGQPAYNNRIGFKAADHWWLTPDSTSWCPREYPKCRFADAALVRYEVPAYSDQARVAFPGLGSTAFDSRLWITGMDAPYVGQPVHMIAATSGRRFGYVTRTCAQISYLIYTKMCQGVADYFSTGGDSGSPVVALISSIAALGIGIEWGGHDPEGSFFTPLYAALDEVYEANPSLGRMDPSWPPPPPPPPPINVNLTGPSSVRSGATCLWTATPTQGVGPYSYAWFVNSASVGNGSSHPQELVYRNSGSNLLVEVHVTDAGGAQGTNSRNVTISGSAPICEY